MKSLFIVSALAFQQAAGHAIFQQLWVDGVDKSNTCIRMPASNTPVTNVGSNDIRCNAGGTRGVSGKCTVAAGGTVTVEMHQVRPFLFNRKQSHRADH
jgi:cellulase